MRFAQLLRESDSPLRLIVGCPAGSAGARAGAPPHPCRGTVSMSDPNARNAPSEQESRDVAEAARETEWTAPSFVRELFLGNLRLDLIHPFPRQSPEDKAKTDAYMAKLRAFMEDVDSDAIDRTGEIP